MVVQTMGSHISLTLLLRYFISAVKTELRTRRQFRLAVAALQFGLHVKPAGGAEVVVFGQVSVALGTFSDSHHLVAAVGAEPTVYCDFSVALWAIYRSLFEYMLHGVVMIEHFVKHARDHHAHARTYAQAHSGGGASSRASRRGGISHCLGSLV